MSCHFQRPGVSLAVKEAVSIALLLVTNLVFNIDLETLKRCRGRLNVRELYEMFMPQTCHVNRVFIHWITFKIQIVCSYYCCT